MKKIFAILICCFSLLFAYAASAQGVSQEDLENWRRAAEQGNPAAQFNIALSYYKGAFGAGKESEGARWLRKSAEQGYDKAQGLLGVAYYQGSGVPKDNAEAAKWLEKSAAQGNQEAQSNLNYMYQKGEAVKQSPEMVEKHAHNVDSRGTSFVTNPNGFEITFGPVGQFLVTGTGLIDNSPDVPKKVADALEYLSAKVSVPTKKHHKYRLLNGILVYAQTEVVPPLPEYPRHLWDSKRDIIVFGVPLNAVEMRYQGYKNDFTDSMTGHRVEFDCLSNLQCIFSPSIFGGGLEKRTTAVLMGKGNTDDGVYNAMKVVYDYALSRYGKWVPNWQTDAYGGSKRVTNIPDLGWVQQKKTRCSETRKGC